jgi:hypothetical protein
MRRRPRLSRSPRSRLDPLARISSFIMAAALAAGSAAGCATSGVSTPGTPATCGRTRTGVNVAVVITIGRGSVSCPAAMTVEKSYAALIRAGDVRGNGGGAPVSVHGWTCQGYTSAEITRTSRVSVCVQGSAEIFAVLPPPAAANAPPAPS